MTTNRERIQNKLIDLAEAGPFYGVSYESRRPIVSLQADTTPIHIKALETGSEFDQPDLNRQSFIRERSNWTWELRLQFKTEVNLEAFEELIAAEPPVLLSTSSLRQVTLLLEKSDPEHPVQQQASQGTQVVYTFEAHLSPA